MKEGLLEKAKRILADDKFRNGIKLDESLLTLTELKAFADKHHLSIAESLNFDESLVRSFIEYVKEQLNIIEHHVLIKLSDQKDVENSFAYYIPSQFEIFVYCKDRHLLDCFRSLAHEMIHFKQDIDKRLNKDSGKDGSDIENEANALAGVIMRGFGRKHPDLF